MRYIIHSTDIITGQKLNELVKNIKEILDTYNSSKIPARIYQEKWADDVEYIVEVGYFDRYAIDEIRQLDFIETIYQILDENQFSLVEELVSSLSKNTQDLEKFSIDFIIQDNELSRQKILDAWNIKDRICNEANDSFIFEINGNKYRLLKEMLNAFRL